MELTSKQIAHLRGLAQRIEATVHVGQAGTSDALLASLEEALAAHELVKVRLHAHKEQRKELAPQLAARTGSVLVHLVGNVVVLYRQQADPEKRKVIV